MFPLSFVVGAAVGAVTTYVLKDEPTKRWLTETGSKLKKGSKSFGTSFTKKQEEKEPEDTVEVVAESKAAEEKK